MPISIQTFIGNSFASGISGYSGAGGGGGSGTGESGFSGISGYSGQDGAFSASGFSGFSGESGYSGYTGLSGFSGSEGASGFSGVSGYSGAGTSGFSGFSGQGIPSGGVSGQALVKISSSDYDTAWQTITGAGTGGFFQGALLSKSTAQTIPADTWTTITNYTTVYDTSNFGITANRFTIPAGVTKVQLFGSISGASNTTQFIARIIKNGDPTAAFTTSMDIESEGADTSGAFTPVLTVVAGDYFELQVFSGTSRSLGTVAYLNWFSIQVVDGVSGFSGQIGSSGFSGFSGPAGGPPGDSGFSGTSGFSGSPGATSVSYSVYFDGSGDYLTVPSSTDFQFGTGDVTVELWFNLTANASLDPTNNRTTTVISSESASPSTGWLFNILGDSTTTGTAIKFQARNSGVLADVEYTSAITKNVWHHVAFVRSGNTASLYYDGVRVVYDTNFTATITSSNAVRIAGLVITTYPQNFPGYLSNIRIVKGSAVYSGASIIVPTSPLNLIPNTVLLVCQRDVFQDVTAVGNSAISDFNPFGQTTGNSGFSGISGYSGTGGEGTSGFSGISGFSGDSGYSSFSGYSGLSGYSGSGSVTVSNDTATNSTYYPLLSTSISGTLGTAYTSDSKLTFNPSTGTLSATELNSLSDIALKDNVSPILNALNIIDQLSGVTFDWKETGKPSAGVTAQNLEEVFPSLVNVVNGYKTVNYNGIIAILIEAIKLLSDKISNTVE